MSSEKVAVTLVVAATLVAPAVGTVLTIVGGVVSPPCVVDTVKDLVAGEVSVLPARRRIPLWNYLLFVPLLVAWMAVCSVVFAPTEEFLLGAFSWLPDWFVLESFGEGYARSAVVAWFIAELVVGVAILPVVEEMYFRGYLLPRISRLGRWAPVLNSGLFALQHFWVPWGILLRFFGALPYIYFAQRKKNIYVGVGVHVIVNLIYALMIAAVILG